MRRILSLVAVTSAAAVLGACGGTDVVVQAQIQGMAATDTTEAETGPTPLAGIEVQLVPYDRDAIFDSLASVAATPEPQIPDTLLQLQEQISEASVANQQATARWNTVRDSLQQLSEQLNQLSPASPRYRVLFRDFTSLEDRVGNLEQRMDSTFRVFTQLQSRFTNQAEELRLQRGQWADEAFRSVDSIFLARSEEAGQELLVDTTNAQGVVRFRGVDGGDWWVHARYELPYEELYWNEPVQVQGDQVDVSLNRENAEVRPAL